GGVVCHNAPIDTQCVREHVAPTPHSIAVSQGPHHEVGVAMDRLHPAGLRGEGEPRTIAAPHDLQLQLVRLIGPPPDLRLHVPVRRSGCVDVVDECAHDWPDAFEQAAAARHPILPVARAALDPGGHFDELDCGATVVGIVCWAPTHQIHHTGQMIADAHRATVYLDDDLLQLTHGHHAA